VGPFGEKWRHLLRKVGEWYVVSQHLQSCSPRLRRLRTNGLAPTSEYWTYWLHAGVYGLSKPSNLQSTKGGFTPTASMSSSGEKLGTDPRIGQPSCCGLCQEPFSQEQWLCTSLLTMTRKVAICGPHEIRMVLDHTWTGRGKHVACWSGFPLQGVHRFKSSRLLDMSNHLFVVDIT
jgi:hypothetical protein